MDIKHRSELITLTVKYIVHTLVSILTHSFTRTHFTQMSTSNFACIRASSIQFKHYDTRHLVICFGFAVIVLFSFFSSIHRF